MRNGLRRKRSITHCHRWIAQQGFTKKGNPGIQGQSVGESQEWTQHSLQLKGELQNQQGQQLQDQSERRKGSSSVRERHKELGIVKDWFRLILMMRDTRIDIRGWEKPGNNRATKRNNWQKEHSPTGMVEKMIKMKIDSWGLSS